MAHFRRLLIVLGIIGSAFAMACSSGGGGSGATKAPAPASTAAASVQSVNLTAMEILPARNTYAYDPATLQVNVGQVVVHFTNPDGNKLHSFELKTLDGSGDILKSDEIEAGKTVDLQCAVTAPGTYKIICYERGHESRGMTGTLTVVGAPS